MANEVFSRRLKSARLMRGMSMDNLCERMKNAVSKQSISKYETGKMMPDSTTLIALSQALGVNVDFFFRPYNVSLDGIEFRKKSRLRVSSLKAIKEKVLDEIERYLEIENLLEIDNLFMWTIATRLSIIRKRQEKSRSDYAKTGNSARTPSAT